MVKNHMRPNMAASSSKHDKSFMRIFDSSCCPGDLLLLSRADYLGRQTPTLDRAHYLADYRRKEEKLHAMLALYRQRMAEPYLMGRDLIDAGVEPGPVFSRALEYAHKLRLAGIPKEEQLRQTLGYIRRLEKEQTK
jgi:tRNA nucleotidyltransferase (CCA-adding enzyme)